MGKSAIEWTERTWNPITGCSKISTGCKNCYAERMAKRLAGRAGYPADDPFRVTFHENRLEEPLKVKKPSMFFVCSMGDIFHEDVDTEWIDAIFEVIMACPQHIFQILTKRADIMEEKIYGNTGTSKFRALGAGDYMPNAWLGATIENQEQADKRIPELLKIPAAKHFVSVEPMLGPVDTVKYMGGRTYECECGFHKTEHSLIIEGAVVEDQTALCAKCGKYATIRPAIDWVICGGESGPGARPMHPDWARNLRDQCKEAGVPFFFKQWGEWAPREQLKGGLNQAGKLADITFYCPHGNNLDYVKDDWAPGLSSENTQHMVKVGKKKAGRMLDGVLHDGRPK